MERTRNIISPGDSGKPDFWDQPLTPEQQLTEDKRLGIDCRALKNCMPRWEQDHIETEEMMLDRHGAT